jgi:crotonobetainyl-CoA:carnitine CoA-transferase CaiB-like acyl-CoA transferase
MTDIATFTEADARPLPLAGVRVVDMSRLIGGALATLKLADLGADVVKVEEPGRGDYLREIPPFVKGKSLVNELLNRNKRSIALDFRDPVERATLDALVATAEVVVEVSRPGRLLESEVDLDGWQRRDPKLTICSITGFGQTGPLADLPAHGMNIDALAAIMPVGLRPDGRPTIGSDIALGLELGAMNAVTAVLASVIEARATGRGRRIDISCWDAAAAIGRLDLAHRVATGKPSITPRELGAFYDLYAASDGQLVLFCAIEQKFWEAFCTAIGRPDLLASWGSDSTVDYGSNPGLRAVLDDVFASRTADEWQQLFVASGVPGCKVVDAAGLVELDHFSERRIAELEPADGLVALADAIRWSDGTRPGQRRTLAPKLGEHSDQIIEEWLGSAAGQDGARPSEKALGSIRNL